MKVLVEVFLKEVVLDPQGKTIQKAVQSLGYETVSSVRAGKIFALNIDSDDPAEAERIAEELARKLLANTVIEDYKIVPAP